MNSNESYVPPTIQLTDEQKRMVDETLRNLQELGPLIQKAELCGIDCHSYEALRQHLHELMSNVKREFMPPREPMIVT